MATTIRTATQLQNMSADLTADYELGNDIDASITAAWNGGLGFDPIGTYTLGVPADAFSGSFDGKGYKIKGLTINRPLEDYVGLFGYTLACGEIKNVELEDCVIDGIYGVGALVGFHEDDCDKVSNCHVSGTLAGLVLAGGMLGYNGAEVEDCHSDVVCTFTGGVDDISQSGGFVGLNGATTITRCYATGNVTATSDDDIHEIGGFAGINSGGRISRCFATGNVAITAGDEGYSFGGFIGDSGGTDGCYDCYTTGDVTSTVVDNTYGWLGGFCGISYETLEDCYSTGLVTITAGQPDVGGFVGENNGGTVTDCFWDTQTSGQALSDGGTGKTTAQMKSVQTIQAAGWAVSTIWSVTYGCNNGYPCLLDVNACCAVIGEGIDQTIVGDKVSLEAIRNLEIVYGGRAYISKSGDFIYESRYHRNV